MKTMFTVALIGWAVLMGSAQGQAGENVSYEGKARALLTAPAIEPWIWGLESGIEIDDLRYPPYVAESDEQAARTNRLLLRLVEKLRPAGVLSMAHHKLFCQGPDQDLKMDWEVELMVFKTPEACQFYWQQRLPEAAHADAVIVDNLGDLCFKRVGQTITYLYLRRANVYVEVKGGDQDHGAFFLWLQALDQQIVTPVEPAPSESTDPNTPS